MDCLLSYPPTSFSDHHFLHEQPRNWPLGPPTGLLRHRLRCALAAAAAQAQLHLSQHQTTCHNPLNEPGRHPSHLPTYVPTWDNLSLASSARRGPRSFPVSGAPGSPSNGGHPWSRSLVSAATSTSPAKQPQLPFLRTTESLTRSLFKRQSPNSSPSRHGKPDGTRPTDAPRHTSPSGKLPPVIEGAAGGSPHGFRHPQATHLSGPTLLGSILASLHAAQNVESTLKRSPMSFNSTPGLPARGLPIWPQSLLAFPYPHYLEPRKAAKH